MRLNHDTETELKKGRCLKTWKLEHVVVTVTLRKGIFALNHCTNLATTVARQSNGAQGNPQPLDFEPISL